MNIILVFLTFGIWAWSFPLGKWAANTGSILFVTSIRQLLASLLLLSFLWIYNKKKFILKKSQLKGLIILGIFGLYLTNYLELFGLKLISSSRASLIYGLSPFIAALLSYIKLKEKVTLRKCLGLTIGFAAFIPVFVEGGWDSLTLNISIGDLALLGATFLAMYGWVILRDLVKEKDMDPVGANAWAMLFGGLACLIHSFFADEWSPVPIINPKGLVLSVTLLVIISNLICSNLYSFLLKRFTVTFLALAGMTSPFFAGLWGTMFFGEPFEVKNFLCAIVMLVGLWVVYREERRLELSIA